ncbi:MAG: YraN family protein [Elusimicrobiota bacterium]
MRELGKKYEDIACRYLEKNGYRIIERNFLTKLGEIDIVARDRKTLCFVEIKARKDSEYEPFEAVNKRKMDKIIKSSIIYLKVRKVSPSTDLRYDVLSITGKIDSPDFFLIKDAFKVDRYF